MHIGGYSIYRLTYFRRLQESGGRNDGEATKNMAMEKHFRL